jgi:hypothetical protein
MSRRLGERDDLLLRTNQLFRIRHGSGSTRRVILFCRTGVLEEG